MSAAVLDRPRMTGRARIATEPVTLGAAIAGVWKELAAHRAVACPLCGGPLAPRYGASGMAPVGGRCNDCDTTLA